MGQTIMTNLKRYDLGSRSTINWYESPNGNICEADEAIAIIESLQSEVAAKDARIDRLLADLERGDKRIIELLKLNQSLERRIAELESQLAAAQNENATLAGLALDATNIFSYTEPVE